MSSRSSTVHTLTATPAACACFTNRGVTMTVRPERSGTWNSRYAGRHGGSRIQDPYSAQRVSSREAPVATAGSIRRIAFSTPE
jgi:hypothetical protein